MPNLSPKSEHPQGLGWTDLQVPLPCCLTSRNHSVASAAAPCSPLPTSLSLLTPGASPLPCSGLLLLRSTPPGTDRLLLSRHETPYGRTWTQPSLPGPLAPRFPRPRRPTARPPRVVQARVGITGSSLFPQRTPHLHQAAPRAELPPGTAGYSVGSNLRVCLAWASGQGAAGPA